MKQSDIITIVLITMIGTIAAGFAVNAILGNPDDASETWKTIKVVDSDLVEPNPSTFNADAVNPTVEVYVGNCVDIDQDEVLSYDEQVACGWRSSGSKKNSEEEQSSEDNGTSTVEEIIRKREAEAQKQTTPTVVKTDDETRKEDMDKLLAQMAVYQANNGGKIPADATQWNVFLANYLKVNNEFKDPAGMDYTIDYDSVTALNALMPDGVIHIYPKSGCTTEGKIASAAGENAENRFAVMIKLDESGYYCVDNRTSSGGTNGGGTSGSGTNGGNETNGETNGTTGQ